MNNSLNKMVEHEVPDDLDDQEESPQKPKAEVVVSKTGKTYKRQPDRITVRISPIVWAVIEPIFVGRRGAPFIDEVASELNLHETMRLLAQEPQAEIGVRNAQLYVTPSDRLMARARRLYVGPHILCRAAAVKIMQAMNNGEYVPRPKGRPRRDFGQSVPENILTPPPVELDEEEDEEEAEI